MSVQLSKIAYYGGLLIILTFAGWIFQRYYLADSGIPDSIGYMQASHQLARGQGLAFNDQHNEVAEPYYTLFSFKLQRPPDYRPYYTYPPGLPLLVAPFALVTGQPGAIHVGIAVLFIVLLISVTYLVRQWTSTLMSLIVTLILLGTPTFLMFSTSFWSEMPGAAVIYGGYALYVSQIRRRVSRGALALCFTAGILVIYSILIRYANIFLLPAFLLFPLGQHQTESADSRSRYAFWFGLGLGAIGLLSFNQIYYGGPFTTGYSSGQNGGYGFPLFSLRYMFDEHQSVPVLLATIWDNLGFMLLFVVLAIVRTPFKIIMPWLALIACILVPHAVYAFPTTGINSRFILVSLPAFCLLIACGLDLLRAKLRRPSILRVCFVLIIVAAFWKMPQIGRVLDERNRSSDATLANILEFTTPTSTDSVFISYIVNDVIAFYGHRSVLNYRSMPEYDPIENKYDYSKIEAKIQKEVQALLDQDIPVYYVIDSNPPLYHSDTLLKKYFRLERMPSQMAVFRVLEF